MNSGNEIKQKALSMGVRAVGSASVISIRCFVSFPEENIVTASLIVLAMFVSLLAFACVTLCSILKKSRVGSIFSFISVPNTMSPTLSFSSIAL